MARNFNRSNPDFISMTASPLNGYPFTMSCWLTTTDPTLTGSQTAFHCAGTDPTNHNTIQMGVDAGSSTLFVDTRDSGGTDFGFDIGAAISANTWYFMAFVGVSATSRTGYILQGGVLSSTTKTTNCVLTSTLTHSNIGRFNSASGTFSPFSGKIADVAAWTVALTAGEVAGLAGGMRPYQIQQKNLTGYWPLDGLASPEPDFSGSANNGTLSGTPTLANGPPITMFTPRWRQLVLPATVPTAAFRKTASRIGTRTGTRQTWAA